MVFVSLPVKGLNASKEVFPKLGFTFNNDFTNDEGACMVVDENIFCMLLTEPHFKGLITGDISDAHKSMEVINCLSCQSWEEVDDMVATALAAGGKEWKPKIKQHVWLEPPGP